MSKRSDLLVRVRYLNPVPNPPFPPKLLSINTDINRLGEPSYLDHLAASTPLPMLVDSEMGMPLDLNAYDGVWDGRDQAINPSIDAGRVHHPVDVLLLAPFQASTATNGDHKPVVTTEVSWMRNSSYLTRKNTAKRREAADARAEEAVDASEAAQILAIEKTFMDLQGDVKDIKHPDSKKKDLTVVENPAAFASSARLANAVLRPVNDGDEEDQTTLEYYLPKEEDLAKMDKVYETPIGQEQLNQLTELSQEEGDTEKQTEAIFPHVLYDRIRTYEVVSQTQLDGEPIKEILVSFQEGQGVSYKKISTRTLLRKTRARGRGEAEPTALWNKTRLGYRLPHEDEIELWKEVKDEVSDPLWANAELRRLHGGDNQAEGQGEAIDDEELAGSEMDED